MEYGETASQALIREFKEEVGLSVDVGKLVMVQDSIPPNLHRQVLNLYFLARSSSYEIHVTQDQVLKDAAFFPINEFLRMKVNPDVKQEIVDGIKTDWVGNPVYLGNRWND
jgi:ADP-ribose pyrophosphatase YjhB (NUDIX family)